jgi:hypothetical protein
MKFLVLVPANKDSEAGVMPSQEMLAKMGKFNEELVNAGMMVAGEGLHPTSKASRVVFEGGKKRVVDGPFTESKELIAGFWVLQGRSREEIVEWIKRAPFDTGHGDRVAVEIRQIFDPSDFAASDPTGELRAKEAALRARAEKQNS